MNPGTNHTDWSRRSARYLFWKASNKQALGTSLLVDPKWREFQEGERAQIFDEILGDLRGKRVLELGAGIGRFTGEFAARGARVTAVDFVDDVLQENQTRNQAFDNIEYICADATALRLEPGSYDLVFANWLLMYLTESEIADLLGRIGEWLAPEGRYFSRESCEYNYTGHTLWKLWTMEWVRTVMPGNIGGRAIFRFWNFSLPPLRDIWRALRGGERPQRFRSAAEYESFLRQYFEIETSGHIKVWEQKYGNREQRFWLLRPARRPPEPGAP